METSPPCHNLSPRHHPVFMLIQIVRWRVRQAYSDLL